MTDEAAVPPGQTPAPALPEPPSQRRRLPAGLRWVTGAIGPAVTTLIAFLMGGLVVVLTGKNPFKVYHAVFNGTGLNWFFHVGSYSARVPFATSKMWFPFDTSSVAAQNLQQTLLLTTPIILTALAVAFAFRCGMFNIGGQGQYFAGTIFAVWLGSSFSNLNPFVHVALCLVVGALAGAAYAGIAGLLKATVGSARGDLDDHAQLDRGLGRVVSLRAGRPAAELEPAVDPDLQRHRRGREAPGLLGARSCCRASRSGSSSRSRCSWSTGSSSTARPSASRCEPSASTPSRPATAASRSPATTSSRWPSPVRSPDSRVRSTSRAGSTGSVRRTSRRTRSGSSGLAAALLGRNTAVGVGFASLLFGALINGTSGRQLDPSIFRPDLAGNLTTIIQGLVILFVGLNLNGVVRWVRRSRRMTAITARVGGIRWGHPRTIGIVRDRARRAGLLARAAAAGSADGRAADFPRHARDSARHLGLGPR